MKNITIHIILLVAAIFVFNTVIAQDNHDQSWYAEKIVGKRFSNDNFFRGSQYIINDWTKGTLLFENGEKVSGLDIRYNSFLDQLIYFNPIVSVEILIDKNTITGFTFDYKSKNYTYKKIFFPNFPKGIRYFEVIYDGFVDVLCYRKTTLLTCPIYKSISGSEKNQEFSRSFRFYIYLPEKGFVATKMRRGALLSNYSNNDKKEIRKLLRKKNITISNEYDFGSALKVIESAGFNMNL